MKPSNEDRRAIAKTLRRVAAIDAASLKDGEFVDFMMEIVLGGDVRMDPQDHDAEFLNCLADLIEPEERTCRMKLSDCTDSLGQKMYRCSECGALMTDDACFFEGEPDIAGFSYCPNCGAKVVSE